MIPSLLKIALLNILKNRMRTLLTMLGIIIGVAAVITMVSVGQGAQERIRSQIESMGTNLLTIFPGSGRFGGMQQTINRMTLDDVDKIKTVPAVGRASAVVRSSDQVIFGTGNLNTTISGVSPDFFGIRSWSVQSGRLFFDNEVKTSAKVALLGHTVDSTLFGERDPGGCYVRIRNVPFRVLGVLAEKGSSPGPGGDQDDAVYIPVTTALNRLTGGRYVNEIMVGARSSGEMDSAQSQIAAVLRRQHRLHARETNDFTIMNQTEIINMAAQSTQVLTLLLGSIAGVSLIVGGIGIMNIMLVSVSERTREIGIRLAVGARSGDILFQFIVEAAVISMVGGLVGCLTGIGLSMFLNFLFKVSISLSPIVVLSSFLFSGAVGVFFGFYPARRASEMNPIEALRYE